MRFSVREIVGENAVTLDDGQNLFDQIDRCWDGMGPSNWTSRA